MKGRSVILALVLLALAQQLARYLREAERLLLRDQSKKFLLEELLVLMGGRAAEKTFYDSTTNGAAGDLDMARKLAKKMIHEWGMGEKLYYEADQKDAEAEINRLLANADDQAHELIQAHKQSTEKLARALLAQEKLTREEVFELLNLDKRVELKAAV